MTTMMKDGAVVLAYQDYMRDVYCHHCQQLWLWGKPEPPTLCANCQSTEIEIDSVGSARLLALREKRG